MRRGRRRPATIDDVVELLQGIGTMLQRVDAKLETIVSLLEEEEDDEAGS
jgi:hypothetical protein